MSDKWGALETKVTSTNTTKSPVANKRYNGNASDSDDSEVRHRHKVEEKYKARGSHLNSNQKQIVNYIINTKAPVYSFMAFLDKKPRKQKHVRIDGHLLSTKNKGESLDIQSMKKYMSSYEIE